MTTTAISSRAYRRWLIGILLVAGLGRLLLAAAVPVIARDGVTFCWYARELGRQGLDYLQTPEAQQHPLFPAMILGVQRIAVFCGAPDVPLTWQRCGQLICWLAGMGVVALAGVLTGRLLRRLDLPVDRRLAVLCAVGLAALLPLNVQLSVDVMSDSVHLLFYLAAVVLLVNLNSVPAALACGLLSALAFMTRQEGFVPAAAGIVVLAGQWRHVRWSRLAARGGVLLLAFVVCVAPYWMAVGRFSSKKDVSLWSAEEVARSCPTTLVAPASCRWNHRPEARATSVVLAKLRTRDVPWYGLLPYGLYQLFRAGRVVIPLLAVPAIWHLRRKLLGPELLGVTSCMSAHVALALALLDRHGYLAVRHMLVPTMLLVPLAGVILAHTLGLAQQARKRWLTVVTVAVCGLPLLFYALRMPNYMSGYLGGAATWLGDHDPDLSEKRLLSGSSARRIAFYADMRWEYWPEQPEYYGALVRQITSGGAGYFAIETGPGFERRQNEELVARLLVDERLSPLLTRIHTRPSTDGRSELHLFEISP